MKFEPRLKKSQAINWDLFIISLINIILAFTGLPLVQPSLPQTPLHVHALADLEDRVDQGKVNQKWGNLSVDQFLFLLRIFEEMPLMVAKFLSWIE